MSIAQSWSGFISAVKKEWAKTLLQVVVSASGFLLALGANSWLASRSEVDTYKSMLKSLKTEATINDNVLTQSYGQYFYARGMVLREFSLTTTQQCLASPLFLKHARPEDVDMLGDYLRNLSLANGYRRISETVTLSEGKDKQAWLDTVFPLWESTVKGIDADLGKIKQIQ